MTHPHQLHAAAALHSLRAARRHLATAADAEARAIAAEAVEPSDGLRGWSPMVGGPARGGHGDPTAGAMLTTYREPRVNRWLIFANSTTATLGWLADNLQAPPAPDPVDRLQTAVPQLHPRTCATLTLHIVDADQRIRRALGMHPDQWRLPPTVACPACSVRLLRAQTSAPDTAAWTIVCTADCLCAGDDCPCGMPVRAAGVRHIWAADSDLARSAFAGDAPTTTKEAA